MAAPVTGALCIYLGAQLECSVWDGEVPRTDASGNAILPNSTVVPTNWPVVKVWMMEPGFQREWNCGTDPYTDKGSIQIQMWATSKVQVQAMLDTVEGLLASETNWAEIDLGGPDENPSYGIAFLLKQWWLGQEVEIRTAKSELLFRGDLLYDTMIHGAVSTT